MDDQRPGGADGLRDAARALREAAKAMDVVAGSGNTAPNVAEFDQHAKAGVGSRIREARRSAGLKSAGDLADALGVSQKTAYRFESGESSPSGVEIAKICQLAGCDPNWILIGSGRAPAKGA